VTNARPKKHEKRHNSTHSEQTIKTRNRKRQC